MIHISALLLPMKTSHVALSQSNMAVKAVSDWGTLHCSRASSSLNVRLSLPETKPETNALLYEIMSCPQLSPKGQSKVSITASSWRTDAPHFLALCFIALSQIFLFFFFFLQIEHLWQCCLKQVCWYHFSNSISSLHVSMKHFGNSCSISNFFILIFIVMICDQMSDR